MTGIQRAGNPAPATIVIALQPTVRVLLVCMSLLIMAGLAGTVSTWFLGDYTFLRFLRKFDVDMENSVPTWFSTICLFLCAIALAAIALTEWRGKGPLRLYWFGLTGTFVLLSLEEAASFHETLSAPLRNVLHTGSFLHFAWVIPGGFFVAGFLWVFWGFLRQIPAETRRGFLIAGFVYCSGSLGVEMINGRYLSLHGEDFNYSLMCVLEESLEMAGVILFLRSLLSYLADHVGSLTVGIHR